MRTQGWNPFFSFILISHFNWAVLDLNQRRINQRIYNPPPLITRARPLILT